VRKPRAKKEAQPKEEKKAQSKSKSPRTLKRGEKKFVAELRESVTPTSKKPAGKEEKLPGQVPPRPRNAYTLFTTSLQKEIKAEGFEQKEVFGEAGKRWKALSEEAKAPWDALATAEKVRELERKAEVEKKGFFLMEDGTKSTDPANAKLFKVKKTKK